VRKAETAPASAARAHAYLCMISQLFPLLAGLTRPAFQGTSCPFYLKLNAIICECLANTEIFLRVEHYLPDWMMALMVLRMGDGITYHWPLDTYAKYLIYLSWVLAFYRCRFQILFYYSRTSAEIMPFYVLNATLDANSLAQIAVLRSIILRHRLGNPFQNCGTRHY